MGATAESKSSDMMINLEQVQDRISGISDVDVRLVSRPFQCGIYSAFAPKFEYFDGISQKQLATAYMIKHPHLPSLNDRFALE